MTYMALLQVAKSTPVEHEILDELHRTLKVFLLLTGTWPQGSVNFLQLESTSAINVRERLLDHPQKAINKSN